MNSKKIKMEDRVMSQIKEKKVTLRSKYLYLAEKFGRFGGFFVFLILGVLFFVLLFWYFRSTDNLVYLRFGRPGIIPFLQTFPYFFLLALITLITGAGVLIKNIYYKRPFGVVLGIVIFSVLVVGGTLVSLGLHQKMEKFVLEKKDELIVRPFVRHGQSKNGKGVAGLVLEKHEDGFVLKNMCSEQKISWLNEDHRGEDDFSVGDFIVGIGEWRGADFFVFEVKKVEEDRLKMVVGRGSEELPPPPEYKLNKDSENWQPKACINQ